MSDELAPIAYKLQRYIRLLSSDIDGEVIAAARALNRTLKNFKLDIHALADSICALNGKKFSEDEAKEIFFKGGDAELKPDRTRNFTTSVSTINPLGTISRASARGTSTDCVTIPSANSFRTWSGGPRVATVYRRSNKIGYAIALFGWADEHKTEDLPG